MRQQITNNQLIALEADILNQMNNSPAFFFFNMEKCKRFYQQNNLSLKMITDRMNGIIKKYVVHENDQPKTEDKDGQKLYVFATTDDEKAYREETAEFLNRSIYVEL